MGMCDPLAKTRAYLTFRGEGSDSALTKKYGPEERKLLETAAGAICTAMPWRTATFLSTTPPQRGGHARRSRPAPGLGLLIAGRRGRPVHRGRPGPGAVRGSWFHWAVQGAELLDESAVWAETFSNLGQVYRKSPSTARQPDHRDPRLHADQQLHPGRRSRRRQELMTAQPHGRRPAMELALAIERDIQAPSNRGIRMRTLYQHSARQSPATREYVARGHPARSGGPHARRVLQSPYRRRPAHGHHPQLGRGPSRCRHSRQLPHRLPRRYLRARMGARDGPSPRTTRRASEHRLRRARDDDPPPGRGPQRPGKRQAPGREHADLRRIHRLLKEEYGVQTRFQLGHAMGRASAHADRPEDFEDVSSADADDA